MSGVTFYCLRSVAFVISLQCYGENAHTPMSICNILTPIDLKIFLMTCDKIIATCVACDVASMWQYDYCWLYTHWFTGRMARTFCIKKWNFETKFSKLTHTIEANMNHDLYLLFKWLLPDKSKFIILMLSRKKEHIAELKKLLD